jgi:hypothetical protein
MNGITTEPGRSECPSLSSASAKSLGFIDR